MGVLSGRASIGRTPALHAVAVPADPSAVISVWCGRPGEPPVYHRAAEHEHYGASIVKLAVMLALYQAGERGEIDLDERVLVTDRLTALLGGTFRADPAYDNDERPWVQLGRPVSLRWLCERMIVSSSNLASNLLLARLGFDAVNRQCPPGMSVGRQIGDVAARAAGITNTTSAAASAALLATLVNAHPAGSAARRQMLDLLGRREQRDGIPAGLPPEAEVGSKTGWIDGVRHDCAIITGPRGVRYLLAVCTTGLADAHALELIGQFAGASWQDREQICAGSRDLTGSGRS